MTIFNEKTFVPDENTDWYNISIHQKLSEKFIEKHFKYINIFSLCENKNLSDELKKEIKKWDEIDILNREYYYDFLEKIEDRLS